ncbi:hypothetical protein DSO57_1026870 [Entomophthora muscae]|uniref:Uncharacterized protein n=1 Tax=Entomophthora muscae TaxID=34485 RepID=A0ACC2T2T1_9FUNG|nr:hypothetical protein DSO57_1026870 [Entomophthora muscae]
MKGTLEPGDMISCFNGEVGDSFFESSLGSFEGEVSGVLLGEVPDEVCLRRYSSSFFLSGMRGGLILESGSEACLSSSCCESENTELALGDRTDFR